MVDGRVDGRFRDHLDGGVDCEHGTKGLMMVWKVHLCTRTPAHHACCLDLMP